MCVAWADCGQCEGLTQYSVLCCRYTGDNRLAEDVVRHEGESPLHTDLFGIMPQLSVRLTGVHPDSTKDPLLAVAHFVWSLVDDGNGPV